MFPGTGEATCMWQPIREVRAEGTTVWVNELAYEVDDQAGQARFLRLLEPCDRPDAPATLRAWQDSVARDAERVDVKLQVGPKPYRPMVGSGNIDMIPLHERKPEDAWAEEAKIRPAGDGRPPPSDETVAAREAFVQAVLGGAD